MSYKFNKGEWTELFVFLKALSEGKVYAADDRLEKIEDLFYSILSVIRPEKGTVREYQRNDGAKTIRLMEDGVELCCIPIAEFASFSEVVLKAIHEGKSTFEIPEITAFLSAIHVDKIKSSSDNKKDIILTIHDAFTGAEPKIGFSIKSYIGSKPTLLNASGATKVRYRLSESLPLETIQVLNGIDSRNKIKDRLQFLRDKGVELRFDGLVNQVFTRNLQMIDSRMPEFLGYLFLTSYFVSGKSVADVVDVYCAAYGEDSEILSHKVKDLLVAVALGMEPNTKWDGLEDANGGYIVVKENGEMLCYHIYDRNKLRDYLYRHTKFDSPSSKRTGAGLITVEGETAYFSLTVQIRF